MNAHLGPRFGPRSLGIGRIRPLVVAAATAVAAICSQSTSFAWEVPDYAGEMTLVQQPPPSTRLSSTQGSRFTRSAESEIRFQEGMLRYRGGRLQQAEEDFKAVVAADPADVDAYYFLGLTQLDAKRPDDAIQNFSQALRLDSSFEEVYAARARAHLRMSQWDEAEQDINMLRNPQFENEVHYLRGLLAYGRNDLQTARREFEAARVAGGVEATAAGFYEGLTYLRMRELVRARSSFRDSALGNTDPTLAAASRQLDAVLGVQQRTEKSWEAQVTISYEWDSNVIQIGSNIPLPGGISNEDDSRIVLLPRGSWSFIDRDPWEVGVEGNGYFSWHMDLSDFDIASYQAGPFFNWRFAQNWFFSGRYGFNYVELGHEPYLTRHIVTPQLSWIQPNFGYTSGYYQFEARQFDEDVPTDELDRDGQIHALGIVQGINLPPFFRDAGPANMELSYRFEDQVADGSDFDGLFHTLGVVVYVPLPVWKLRADAGISYSYDGYTNANSLDDDGDDREDKEWNFSVGLTKEFTKNVSMRMDYSYTDHESNVESAGFKPYEYDRSQFGIRLILSF